MKKILIPYDECECLIKEGDVLLFQGKGFISKLIQVMSKGKHSHVGIASWSYDKLECIEFREWIGSRSVNLRQYANQMDAGTIDVYRVPEYMPIITFHPETHKVLQFNQKFDGRAVTNCMRDLTGLPYGWKRIWTLALRYFLFTRLRRRPEDYNDDEKLLYPVCSTAISHCFSKNFVDLVHHRSDNKTEPSDLSRSPILNYLFTID